MEGFAGFLCARKHTCKTALPHKNPAVAHIVPLLTQRTGVLVNEIIILGIRCAMLWVWMFMKDCNISGFPVQPRGVNMGQMENDELKLLSISYRTQVFTSIPYLHIPKIVFHGQHRIGAIYQISERNIIVSGKYFKTCSYMCHNRVSYHLPSLLE
jgi:hypothetical protein